MNCRVEVSNNEPLMRIFERNVQQYPQQIALRYRDQTLSYSELNRRANLLAQQLLSLSADEPAPVAVFMRPCADSVVALLAILKAGAIYVPLDVEHPAERLRTIIDDVKPRCILTRAADRQRLPAGHHDVRDIATLVEVKAEVANLPADDDISKPAYIFYTSGTTGKPKGVVGTRQNLAYYVHAAINAFGFDRDLIMPAMARFTFSISLFELMCPLIAGGCLVVLDRDTILSLPALAGELAAVTAFHMGPSLFKALLAYLETHPDWLPKFAALRHVSMGGDMVPATLAQKIAFTFPAAEVFVIYGCSEVACMGCRYPVIAGVTQGKTLVGSPFPGVDLKLLTESGADAAAAEVGEILFSGPGITRGYLHLPELTAEKFIQRDDKIFYRTGDIGRFDQDGNLEILGRSDFQVKIRGNRIELGEIEAQLRQFAGVVDALVKAVAVDGAENSLCAYLVLEPELVTNAGAELDSNLIRAFLKQRLPDYMVPAFYVYLEKFPLNHNLKIDRAALPPPVRAALLSATDFAAPANATEAALIEIWRSILHIDPIGASHDFFELGGESVQAASLIVAVEKQFGREIPISAFFKAPTVRAMALLLSGDNDIARESDSYCFRETGDATIFLLHGALVYRDIAQAIDPQCGVYTVFAAEEARLIGQQQAADVFGMYTDVATIAERYIEEIRRIRPQGPYYLAGFSMGGLVAMEVAKKLRSAGCDVPALFLFDCYLPDFFKRFYWDKVYQNTRKLISRGIPHLQYILQRLRIRLREKRALAAVQNAQLPVAQSATDDIENMRYLARRRASDTYCPERYDGRVILFRATEHRDIGYIPKDRSLGWKKYIRHLFVLDIEGEHLDILKGDSGRSIAGVISAEMQAPLSTPTH